MCSGQCPDGADENSILLQVYDRREMSTAVDELHKLVVDFLKETSKRIDEDMSVSHSEDEISAAVDSIFPRTGFLCWMNLSDVEKATQMLELSNIVSGIRAYNRCVSVAIFQNHNYCLLLLSYVMGFYYDCSNFFLS